MHLQSTVKSPGKKNLADTKHCELYSGRTVGKIPGSLSIGFSPVKLHTLCIYSFIEDYMKQNVDI